MPWYENRNGHSLWYDDRGSGTPVVFLHGWCMDSTVWKYQTDIFADAVRTLAPDLRGHGRSRSISEDLVFDSFANDVVDMFEHLKLSEVVLVGWSMGAQVALQACTQLQEKLSGLILVSATPRFTASDDFPYGLTGAEVNGMRLKVQRNTQRALDGFHTRLFTGDELERISYSSEIKQLLLAITPPETRGALEALDSLARADMRNLLPLITVPALIFNGSNDLICLPRASSYLKEHIAGAEQTVFSECGHAPFLTFKDRFNEELIRFIRRVRG